LPFARALLFGMRPVDLPDHIPLLGRIAKDVAGAFGENAKNQNIANKLQRLDPPLPEPFHILRKPMLQS